MSAGLLPPDDASEGFDNVASGLGISPALIQGYTTAAMKLSRAAVGDMTATRNDDDLPGARQARAGPASGRACHWARAAGCASSTTSRSMREYHFSVRGSFALARKSGRQVDVALDGRRIDVQNLRDFRMPVTAGRHVLTAAIFDTRRPAGVNDIYSVYKVGGRHRQRGRSPGRSMPRGRETPRAGGGYSPAVRKPTAEERGCAERILVDIAIACVPLPADASTTSPTILQFYERGRAEGGFEAGIQQALSRILIDPRFLFRFEAEPARSARHALRVSDIELASRLSFFLWSSIPDARTDRSRGQERAAPARSARGAGAAHAGRSPGLCAGGELCRAVAAPARTGDGDAGSRGLRREPARGVHRGDALAGGLGAHAGSTGDRTADRRLQLPERAACAGTTASRMCAARISARCSCRQAATAAACWATAASSRSLPPRAAPRR